MSTSELVYTEAVKSAYAAQVYYWDAEDAGNELEARYWAGVVNLRLMEVHRLAPEA